MKILMIGPVYPYKGGIAHYTGLMCQALSKTHDVYMMSYKMQYPRLLHKKEQKDYDNSTFKIDQTDYQINTANPINWICTVKKIKKWNPDLIIVQWWHPYFAPCYRSICSGLKHYPIVFLCHNIFPHERFVLDRWLTKIVLNCGTSFIVHSGQEEKDLLSIRPDARVIRTVHPSYNAFKIQDMPREQGRELLSISEKDKVILFFGFVRKYKGLNYLIEALPEVCQELSNVKVLIVGEFDNDKDQYVDLIKKLDVTGYIQIYDGYIPDKEVEKFFAASDVVVLPYESATQSGIVQISYGFEKPVIATAVGGLPEVVIDNKTGYIVPPCDHHALAGKIIEFFKKNTAEQFQEGIQQEAYKYSWDRMVEAVEHISQNS